ncbi:SIR2 family protein [Xenorhabdus sp. SGI240]|uniref:SIR2 family protein n=1 Tax=Xenorhabdus sp. SGI240 TaxID=3158262 RepID=UPI0032B74AB4
MYNGNFFKKNLLIARLANERELSFLFGSAISSKQNGYGIPNVSEIIDIIKENIDTTFIEDYEEHINGIDSDQDKYQASFEFISGISGAEGIKEIIRKIILSNIDPLTSKSKIPNKINELSGLIFNGNLNVNNILTTNFDTLIEESLAELNYLYNSISIVADSNINQNNNELLNIIHLHGIWNVGETMHSKNQLQSSRKKIEASLRNILANNTMYIIGYSGWDDSFTRTLASIVNDDKENYSLAWCFFDENDTDILNKYSHLFDILAPAISRDRVQFYKGINCNSLFNEIEKKKDNK